jgi:hypothetical protein
MAQGTASDLAKKLNLKEGTRIRVIAKPQGLDLDGLTITTSVKADAIIAFVRTIADVDTKCDPVVAAAREDRIAWIAYPKAGQLGTDLNRDILRNHLASKGIQGIRQIAIDEVWSAMRFRPAKSD